MGERYGRPLGLAHWAALGGLARAGALPLLRELRISGCDTGDEGVALLAAGLREGGRLPALRCLYVNAAQVGPAGAAALAAALSARALPALDALVLGGLVGGAGEAALAPALRGLPHLREVHLSATPINDAQECATASSPAPAPASTSAPAGSPALGAPAFVAASSLLGGPSSSSTAATAPAASAAATAAATAAAIAAAAAASIGRLPASRATRGGGSALTDGTVWSAWRLVEGSQREHSDICRRALPAQLVFERRAATLWIMRAAQEFCRCDRTAHLAAAVLELFIRRRAPPAQPEAGWASWVEEHALAALLLACKFQEVDIHMVDEFVTFGGERHDGTAILRAELDVSTALLTLTLTPTSTLTLTLAPTLTPTPTPTPTLTRCARRCACTSPSPRVSTFCCGRCSASAGPPCTTRTAAGTSRWACSHTSSSTSRSSATRAPRRPRRSSLPPPSAWL